MPDLSIIYDDAPAGAADATTPSATDIQPFARLSAICDSSNPAPQCATFEPGYWILGKDYKLFSGEQSEDDWAFFSEQMCDDEGNFATPIVLTLSLSAYFSAVDFVFKFDKFGPTWCSDLDISWYRDNLLLESENFHPDDWQYTCSAPVENFNRMVITFNKLSQGYRFLKIRSISYGTTVLIGSDDISETDLYREADLISDTVAISTFNFKLRNRDDVYYLFQRKQLMKLMHGEEVLGDFFISQSNKLRETYTISSVDAFGLLDMMSKHMGGIYNGVLASTILADILNGEISFEIDSELDVWMYGYLPIAERRENLRQLAFALGAIAQQTSSGAIKLSRASEELSSNVGNARTYENGSVVDEAPITEVRLTVYSYALGTEQSTLFEDVLNGDERIEFGEPVGNLSITGGTIVSSSANHAVIRGTGNSVTLVGTPYVCTQRILAKENTLRNANDMANAVVFEGMTLVSPHNAEDVLNSCFAHSMRREKIKTKILLDGEKPGDFIQIYTEDGARFGHIQSMDYTISTKLAADVVVLVGEEGED